MCLYERVRKKYPHTKKICCWEREREREREKHEKAKLKKAIYIPFTADSVAIVHISSFMYIINFQYLSPRIFLPLCRHTSSSILCYRTFIVCHANFQAHFLYSRDDLLTRTQLGSWNASICIFKFKSHVGFFLLNHWNMFDLISMTYWQLF
jgi:hypothetical protein